MARPRKWKVGDFVYAAGSISGEYFVVQNGIILDIVDEGSHPIKVRLDRSNEITYCRIAQLYKDPKKAKEAVTKNFEKLQAARIKEKAEQQAKEREKVCALEVWCELLNGSKANFPNSEQREIKMIIEKCGWERTRTSIRIGGPYGTQRAFMRKKVC
ncbi:hypothetical protein [Dubosiella newyorkensis]|uniref:hypothetical protein n=1 Tax=Dubosiella newyorkensis TaxID=1862672 RepID=UPI0026F3FE3A|nr:hypothetical protein [Dubosiella newyorkensis]